MKRPAIVLLLALNAILVTGLAAIWIDPAGHWRNVRWTPPRPILTDYQQMLPALPQERSIRTDAFLALLERPVFSSTRRPPPPPPPPAAEAPADVLTGAKLLGIYQTEGVSGIIAMVDGKNRRIRVNEMLGAWRLRSVNERSVVFESGGATRELPLLRAQMVGVAPQSPVSSAPAAGAATLSPAMSSAPLAATAGPVAPAATGPASAPSSRRPRFGP